MIILIEISCFSKNKAAHVKEPQINNRKKHDQSALYSLEELDRFNVPPTTDLNNLGIDYENEEFLHIGHVKAILETLGRCL